MSNPGNKREYTCFQEQAQPTRIASPAQVLIYKALVTASAQVRKLASAAKEEATRTALYTQSLRTDRIILGLEAQFANLTRF